MGNRTSRQQPRPAEQGQQAASPTGPGNQGASNAAAQQPQGARTNEFYPAFWHASTRPQAQRPGQPTLSHPNNPTHGRSFTGIQPSPQLTKTATIRNSVNLKKNTLCLMPLGADQKQLQIKFTFDISSPCRVSTFVAATEEPSEGSRISSASKPWAPPVYCEKGLGLSFPTAGSPDASQHIIDLRSNSEDSLLAKAGANTYPLIIRLESITERGLKDGHSLKELPHGGAQQSWVQSQTTFASLARGEEGEWEARIIKQQIWVDGISYELQEIYGMEHAAGGGGRVTGDMTDAEAEDRLCVICLVNERDTTVLPCRHMCMCHECAQELRKQTQRCPICRNPVESLLHIRLATKAKDKLSTSFSSATRRSPKSSGPSFTTPTMRPATENV